MLCALLQALKAEPGGAEFISGVVLPLFAQAWNGGDRWRFVSKPVTSLALDGALLAQVRPCLGQY